MISDWQVQLLDLLFYVRYSLILCLRVWAVSLIYMYVRRIPARVIGQGET